MTGAYPPACTTHEKDRAACSDATMIEDRPVARAPPYQRGHPHTYLQNFFILHESSCDTIIIQQYAHVINTQTITNIKNK